jgi:hypothetical protein
LFQNPPLYVAAPEKLVATVLPRVEGVEAKHTIVNDLRTVQGDVVEEVHGVAVEVGVDHCGVAPLQGSQHGYHARFRVYSAKFDKGEEIVGDVGQRVQTDVVFSHIKGTVSRDFRLLVFFS